MIDGEIFLRTACFPFVPIILLLMMIQPFAWQGQDSPPQPDGEDFYPCLVITRVSPAWLLEGFSSAPPHVPLLIETELPENNAPSDKHPKYLRMFRRNS